MQDDTEFQYYVQKNGIRANWQHPSEAELVRSVNVLHGFTRKLVAEKIRMQKAMDNTASGLRWAKGLIGLLSVGLVGSWAVTVIVLKLWVIPLLEKVPR